MRMESGDGWTMYEGDCRDVLPALGAGSVDAVVTDPPYGLEDDQGKYAHRSVRARGIRAGEVASNINNPGYVSYISTPSFAGDTFNVEWLAPAYRVVREHGWLVTFSDNKRISYVIDAAERDGWRLKQTLIWAKTTNPPTFNKNWVCAHESAVAFVKGTARYWYGGGARPSWIAHPRTSFTVATGHRVHPTQKPVALMVEWLQPITQPNDTVLDPYAGSGTTGVACVQTGRRFIGVEIDPGYFDIACRRLEAATMQLKLPLDFAAKPIEMSVEV